MRPARSRGVANRLRRENRGLCRSLIREIGMPGSRSYSHDNRRIGKGGAAPRFQKSVLLKLLHGVVGEHNDIEFLARADAARSIDPADGLDSYRASGRSE